MPDLLERAANGPLVTASDELAARESMREQIARLELELGRLVAEAFPRMALDAGVRPTATSPRALDLGDLERVRDRLAAAVSEARGDLARKGSEEARNRELLAAMLARPEEHKWLRISRQSLGEPGCGHWHSRPRFGLLGMLMGWWRVKVSSGCPL